MLCERCHGKEAVVHLTQIINGHRGEWHLCRECAEKENIMSPSREFFGHDFFRNNFESFFNDGFMDSFFAPMRTAIESLSGPEWSKVHHDFRKDGFLGYPGCYEEFREKVRPAFRHMKESHRHEGKATRHADGKSESPELAELRNKLSKLVAEEKYEEAARVRDEIQNLENKGKRDGGEAEE